MRMRTHEIQKTIDLPAMIAKLAIAGDVNGLRDLLNKTGSDRLKQTNLKMAMVELAYKGCSQEIWRLVDLFDASIDFAAETFLHHEVRDQLDECIRRGVNMDDVIQKYSQSQQTGLRNAIASGDVYRICDAQFQAGRAEIAILSACDNDNSNAAMRAEMHAKLVKSYYKSLADLAKKVLDKRSSGGVSKGGVFAPGRSVSEEKDNNVTDTITSIKRK